MSNKNENAVETNERNEEIKSLQPDKAQEETLDFEEKIEKALVKIVSDTVEGETEKQSGDQEPSASQESKSSQNPQMSQQSSGNPIIIKPLPKGQPVREKAKPVPKGRPALNRNAARVYSQPVQQTGIKKHKGIKTAGILTAMAVVVAGCVYGAGAYYFQDKFFEGTLINGVDCSRLTAAQAEEAIAEKVENYSIEVISRDMETQTIQGSDIEYEYIPDGSVGKALEDQNSLEWIAGFFGGKEVKVSTHISYSQEKLEAQMNSLECALPENQEEPEDAYVAFKDTQFEIVPETDGRTLDTEEALKLLNQAVSDSEAEVNFDEADTYEKAEVRSDDPKLVSMLESCNAYTKVCVTYTFGEETRVLDGATIKDWLTFDENGQFVEDEAGFEQHVKEYVAQLAAEFDTVGKDRNFHTTTGRDIVVGGGNYGWQINQTAEVSQLLENIRSGETVTREPAYSVRGLTAGKNDIGNTYIEVDLSSQHMWYYQDGTVIFESDFVSGNMSYSDRATPAGVCHMYYKQRDQVLRGDKEEDGTYAYEQPVSYWMPFNGGVGFHDADWRSSFGGDIYLTNGSHGCINMPPDKAAELYDLINTEIPIVVFY